MRRSRLTAVFLTIVIDLLGFGLILPLLPLYADLFGASKWMVGLLFASFAGMQFLFSPVWGRISDRVGRRPIILLGLVGSTLSYVLFALAEHFPNPVLVLLLSRVFAGLFGGTITTALAYIADVTDVQQRGRGMALVGAAFGIGFTVGPAIGGLGYHFLGSAAPGWIAAAFSASALLFALVQLPEPERHTDRATRHGLGLGALGRALKVRGVRTILLLVLVATTAFAMFESTLALLAKERFEGWDAEGNGLLYNGFLFSYIGFWLVIAQGWFVRRYMTRVGELRFTTLGALCLAGGLLAIGYAPTPWILAAVAPIAVFGSAMMTPSLASLLSQRTDARSQGEILGVSQSMQSLARIVGPVVGNGLLAQGPRYPYWAGAGLMAVAFALSFRLRGPGPAGEAP